MSKQWGSRISDAINLAGNAQGSLAVSTSGAQSATALSEGVYDVWCDDGAVYLKVAATASDVTTATGYRLTQGATVPIMILGGSSKLGGIMASGTGTLRWHQVA